MCQALYYVTSPTEPQERTHSAHRKKSISSELLGARNTKKFCCRVKAEAAGNPLQRITGEHPAGRWGLRTLPQPRQHRLRSTS